jgi:hypothetical protein
VAEGPFAGRLCGSSGSFARPVPSGLFSGRYPLSLHAQKREVLVLALKLTA